MADYFLLALAGAICLSVYALMSKAIIRYRICDAGLVTWGMGLGAAIASGAALLFVSAPFPSPALVPLMGMVATALVGHWLLNRGLQEGDASMVVPLVSLKIPITAALAFVVLHEAHSVWIYGAVALSAAGVALFGMGKQEAAQGGHGRRPSFAITLACLASLAYAVSDQFVKLGLDAGNNAVAIILWNNILTGVVCAALLMRPAYRRYKVKALDVLLFLIGGTVFAAAVWFLFTSFERADGVTIPNIVLGCRGFLVLGIGYGLNKVLRVPIERQRGVIYLLRAAGTVLLFLAILIVLLG
ncbi:MAG: EamA family transporter [Planctomycetia bacterium]|nr:EamA family transporter [Planctomycetia bacterium]